MTGHAHSLVLFFINVLHFGLQDDMLFDILLLLLDAPVINLQV